MTEQPNKNRTLLIAIAAVAALGCCCLAAGAVGFYFFTTTRSVESSPTQSIEEITPQSDTDNVDIGDPPSGGLGNDILRYDTWQVMAPAAVGLGCDQPIGADSTIEVLQQPDAAGRWVEKWTVACNSGDTYDFEAEFILDDTGATFNIKSLP